MHGPIGSRAPVARGIVLVVTLVATIAPASSVALAADASPEPGGSPADSSLIAETIHGWPGARAEPAGLYSWRVIPGHERWMHKVAAMPGTDEGPRSVEMTFDTLDEPDYVTETSVAVAGTDLTGPYPATPERIADEQLQTWRLDVDDVKVVIIVRSFPGTDPALVAEAEAVVESIRVERTDTGVPRLVFRLQEGWDSG